MTLDTLNTTPPSSGGPGTYNLAYAGAWIVAALGIISGGIAAAGLVAHPSWLSPDVAGTAAVISTICVALAAILPQVTRTPATRETNYLKAAAGVLPDDLAAKHTVVNVAPAPSTPPTTGPTLDDLPALLAELKQRHDKDGALLAQLAGAAGTQPGPPAVTTP